MAGIRVPDVKLPKLPSETVEPSKWIKDAKPEFDRFFKDLYFFLSFRTFINGGHTEHYTGDGFTVTPETSIIFLTSTIPVTSDAVIAIKSVSDIPRILILVNTSIHVITIKNGANTMLGAGDVALQPGQLMFLVYTGTAWVGNAI